MNSEIEIFGKISYIKQICRLYFLQGIGSLIFLLVAFEFLFLTNHFLGFLGFLFLTLLFYFGIGFLINIYYNDDKYDNWIKKSNFKQSQLVNIFGFVAYLIAILCLLFIYSYIINNQNILNMSVIGDLYVILSSIIIANIFIEGFKFYTRTNLNLYLDNENILYKEIKKDIFYDIIYNVIVSSFIGLGLLGIVFMLKPYIK